VLQLSPGQGFHLQEECFFLRTRLSISLLPLSRCIEVVGDWTNLAAAPWTKTALAFNIAQHVALNPRCPKAIAIFSLEISKESLLTRLECAAGRVGRQGFRAGKQLAHEETLGCKPETGFAEITVRAALKRTTLLRSGFWFGTTCG
jgi:replicative DNA helicase